MKHISKAINFIPVNKEMKGTGIIVVGYFPHNTANIESPSIKIGAGTFHTSMVAIPRTLFIMLENALAKANIIDNKAVYICKPTKDNVGCESFAIMFKDMYCLIGSWEQVTNYDHTKLTYYE